MKKYMTKKRIIWLMIFLCLVQFWRIKDVGGVVKHLPVDSECYQNNLIIEVYSQNTYTKLDMTELYDDEYYEKVKSWLKNRKVFACTGWNGFRTAVFIADENNNLIYYNRDNSLIGNETVPEQFADTGIDEDDVSWGWAGAGGDGRTYAPLHPNILQRIDAKIIQWIAKLFY